MLRLLALAVLFATLAAPRMSFAAEDRGPLRAGFAAVEITPVLPGEKPVYMAGYGMNRKATGVHDPLYARAVVFEHGGERVAIAAVDLVGLQYPTVKAIRARLPDFRYVLVSSTHNHEGPDVIGIWGRGPLHRGVNDAYLALVVDRVVECVTTAAGRLTPVKASYGTAADESLLSDSRLPIVKDGVLRVVRLDKAAASTRGDGEKNEPAAAASGAESAAGLIVQWNCHPESLGPRNKMLTADFPWATVAALEKRYRCPVVYVSGAVGGLMSNPADRVLDDQGQALADGTFEYARRYGELVAGLAEQALGKAQPIGLTPMIVSAQRIAVPVQNSLYRAARAFGVLEREGLVWTGNFQTFGEPMTPATADQQSAVESEVAYLRLGELHVACIPGELYPELVYGKFQEPAAPEADFPDAKLERTIASLMPSDKWLLVGLANDELGYIIPKRQWDKAPPYAYGKDGGQYGEINSCGPEVAPILMQVLEQLIDKRP
jgi:hypothetical protein